MEGIINIAGVMPRIGTTTFALQLIGFLKANNYNAAYVERNPNRYIKNAIGMYASGKEDSAVGKYSCEGIDLFPGSEEVREQDMRSLRCRDESYDLCLAECSLSSCGGRAEALREAHRILRPGGKFLLSDVFFQKRTDLEPLLGGDLTWEGWRKAFADAGFRICSMEDESILWKDFFLESLWKGNAEETLLDFFRSAGKAGCGYFLACLEKGEGNGTV